jgi:glycosyltransferase involved in cell wall biosynthesis
MPPITAVLHTQNDALRLGRALETLYPCDDILVVDHGSCDGTVQLAHEYGAHVVTAELGATLDQYLRSVCAGWILCVDPRESLTESLAASLYEWKSQEVEPLPAPAFSVFLREETAEGWVEVPAAQTRLIPRHWNRWRDMLPETDESAVALKGELLRFVFP